MASRLRLGRKLASKVAGVGAFASLAVAVSANHGFGQLHIRVPAVRLGITGFIAFWCFGVLAVAVTTVRHRRALVGMFRKPDRPGVAAPQQHRTFRLSSGRRRSPGEA